MRLTLGIYYSYTLVSKTKWISYHRDCTAASVYAEQKSFYGLCGMCQRECAFEGAVFGCNCKECRAPHICAARFVT